MKLRNGLIALLVLGTAPLSRAQDVPALIAQAETAYAKREDPAQAKAAMVQYEQLATLDPALAAEAYWKASRAAWWVGDRAERRSDRLAFFQKGIDFAKRAVELDPDSAAAHFWLGGNFGSYGDEKGVLKSLSLVKPIRREMAEVNRINDRYDGGGGYRILGVVDYKVPGLMGGSKKRALEELQHALAIDPSEPYTHYYLGDYYWTIGEKQKAKEEFQQLQTLRVAPENEPDLRVLQKKGAPYLTGK